MIEDDVPDRLAAAWARIDTSVSHPARRYDYLLGGIDNFPADRESADRMIAAMPAARVGAQENRRFLRRAVTFLAREAGIRQFLDIGTGIPTRPNVHEIAQAITPSARILYVDNDPIVLTHARARLTSSPEGATAYVDADLRNPDDILSAPEVLRTLDLSEPVALMLVAVLHFIGDGDEPHRIVARLVSGLAPGSFLVVSHGTYDFLPREVVGRVGSVSTAEGFCPRGRDAFTAFFDGLEIVEPGVVSIAAWRAADESEPRPSDAEAGCYGAAGLVRTASTPEPAARSP
jgi:SAM-dependent methyltransferase